jgi:hypothetical protein
MKITKSQLKKIIKEELSVVLSEEEDYETGPVRAGTMADKKLVQLEVKIRQARREASRAAISLTKLSSTVEGDAEAVAKLEEVGLLKRMQDIAKTTWAVYHVLDAAWKIAANPEEDYRISRR